MSTHIYLYLSYSMSTQYSYILVFELQYVDFYRPQMEQMKSLCNWDGFAYIGMAFIRDYVTSCFFPRPSLDLALNIKARPGNLENNDLTSPRISAAIGSRNGRSCVATSTYCLTIKPRFGFKGKYNSKASRDVIMISYKHHWLQLWRPHLPAFADITCSSD